MLWDRHQDVFRRSQSSALPCPVRRRCGDCRSSLPFRPCWTTAAARNGAVVERASIHQSELMEPWEKARNERLPVASGQSIPTLCAVACKDVCSSDAAIGRDNSRTPRRRNSSDARYDMVTCDSPPHVISCVSGFRSSPVVESSYFSRHFPSVVPNTPA